GRLRLARRRPQARPHPDRRGDEAPGRQAPVPRRRPREGDAPRILRPAQRLQLRPRAVGGPAVTGLALATLLAAAGPTGELGGPPPAAAPPPGVAELAWEQRPNARVPLDLTFRDEDGRPARLGDYFTGKPVILVL